MLIRIPFGWELSRPLARSLITIRCHATEQVCCAAACLRQSTWKPWTAWGGVPGAPLFLAPFLLGVSLDRCHGLLHAHPMVASPEPKTAINWLRLGLVLGLLCRASLMILLFWIIASLDHRSSNNVTPFRALSFNESTSISGRQWRRAIEALEARAPPDGVATLVNSLQNRVKSITLCVILNAKNGK